MDSDFKGLLKTFNEHEIKYLIVGGYAVMKYSEPRFTKDLDVWVEPTLENAKKVFQALKNFGAPLTGLTESDFAGDGFYQMGRPPVRVDILMMIDGVQFQDAWGNRVETTFDDVPAYIIGLSDLITNKKNAARPQDLVDIEKMILSQQINEKIKEEKKEEPTSQEHE